MIGPEVKPTVKLIGEDGNAFSYRLKLERILKRDR